MSEGLNRVHLLGNLGADPELRFTQGGQAVLNMRLACTESWFDKEANERKERTEWVNVVLWGKRAESLGKLLTKGSSIFVEGSLRTSSYDDREGNKRWKTEVVAQNVILTGGRRPDAQGDTARSAAPARAAAPARGVAPARGAAPARFAADDSGDGGFAGSDDIPF